MARERYQRQLDGLRSDVLDLATRVIERLEDAVDALETGNEALAREVIEGDAVINNRYLELEKACIDLLALQQPVAGDLRFITASFKIITDLERISDLAVNLGQYTLEGEASVFEDIELRHLGESARDLVVDAMDAYERHDAAACFDIAARDDDLDRACKDATDAVIRELLASRIDEEGSRAELERFMTDVSNLLLTIRDLERVGDHGVNIAARTLYMVEHDDSLIY